MARRTISPTTRHRLLARADQILADQLLADGASLAATARQLGITAGTLTPLARSATTRSVAVGTALAEAWAAPRTDPSERC